MCQYLFIFCMFVKENAKFILHIYSKLCIIIHILDKVRRKGSEWLI